MASREGDRVSEKFETENVLIASCLGKFMITIVEMNRLALPVFISLFIASCANKPVVKDITANQKTGKQSAESSPLGADKGRGSEEEKLAREALQMMADNIAKGVSSNQSEQRSYTSVAGKNLSSESQPPSVQENKTVAISKQESKKLANADVAKTESQAKAKMNHLKTVQNVTSVQPKSAESGVDKNGSMNKPKSMEGGAADKSFEPISKGLKEGGKKVTSPSFTLESLPVDINGWILDLIRSAGYVKGSCFLKSPTTEMPDGQGGTKAYWEISSKMVVLSTRSNIDLSYAGTGLTIGDKQWPLSSLLNETALDFSNKSDAIVAAMLVNEKVTVSVGFWPTWPVTHAYQGSWNIQSFPVAWEALKQCERLWRNP